MSINDPIELAKRAILATFQRFNRRAGEVASERMIRSHPDAALCRAEDLQAALEALLAEGLIELGQGPGWYRLTAAGAAWR